MTNPRLTIGHACLAAAMSAKDGRITKQEVVSLVDLVASVAPNDHMTRAAVRAFANRILLMGEGRDGQVRFAGAELHDFLIEQSRSTERVEAAE